MSQKRSARARWSVLGRRTASSGLGGEPGKETRHICRLTEVGKRGFRLVRGDAPEFLWPLRSWARPSGHRCTIDAAIALGRGCLGVRRLRRRRAPKAPEGGGPTTSPASKAQGRIPKHGRGFENPGHLTMGFRKHGRIFESTPVASEVSGMPSMHFPAFPAVLANVVAAKVLAR